MTHYTRSQWGARAPRAGNPVTNGPKGVAFHWNGPAMRINVTGSCRCATNVRSIQAFHMDGRGWSDIAYDVIACPHGNTFQGRLGTRNGTGANGTNAANRDYMAVMALVGEGEPVGDDLKRAMLAGRALCRKAGAGSAITPHSQHQSTTCPGPTIRAWISEGAPAPAIPPKEAPTMLTQTLKRGDAGPEVRLLQQMLNGLRKAGLTVDGNFGPATEAAVIAAHKTWGIAAPHNVVGPGFRARINAEWANPKPAPTPQPERNWFDMATKEDLRAIVREEIAAAFADRERWRKVLTLMAFFKDPTTPNRGESPDEPRIPLGRLMEIAGIAALEAKDVPQESIRDAVADAIKSIDVTVKTEGG